MDVHTADAYVDYKLELVVRIYPLLCVPFRKTLSTFLVVVEFLDFSFTRFQSVIDSLSVFAINWIPMETS